MKSAKSKKGKAATHRPLTVRQERFCEFVVAGDSQTEAYLKAGYKVPRDDARKHAARMMANDGVKAKIAELRKPQTRKALMSKDFKRDLLRQIAEDGKAGFLVKIRALEVDAKLAGHFEPDRVEVETGPKTLLSIKERATQVTSALAGKYQAAP